MTSPLTKARVTGWAPVKQWVFPLAVLAAAFAFRLAGPQRVLPYYTIYVSLLLLAFMQPVINALRPNFLRNLGQSVVIFGIHAVICYGAFHLLKGMDFFNLRLFAAILVFYFIATFLSVLFRGIYTLLSEV